MMLGNNLAAILQQSWSGLVVAVCPLSGTTFVTLLVQSDMDTSVLRNENNVLQDHLQTATR